MPDLFKSLVWDLVVKAGIQLLFTAVPWLAWGPVGGIVSWIVGSFADQLYTVVKDSVTLQAIQLKNAEFQRAFDDASVKLMIIAREKGEASQEFKDAHSIQLKALSQFVRVAA